MIRASGPRSAVATQRLSSLTHRQEMAFAWPWGQRSSEVPRRQGAAAAESTHQRLYSGANPVFSPQGPPLPSFQPDWRIPLSTGSSEPVTRPHALCRLRPPGPSGGGEEGAVLRALLAVTAAISPEAPSASTCGNRGRHVSKAMPSMAQAAPPSSSR